jgi:hypothetical protein
LTRKARAKVEPGGVSPCRKLKGARVARTRKTTGSPPTEAAETPDDKDRIEDAVVVEEDPLRDGEDVQRDEVSPEIADRGTEETAPEVSAEIAGAEDVRSDTDTSEPPPPSQPETVPEREPPAEEPVAKVAPPPPPARSGGSIVLPLIFGGLIAALAGLAAARFVFPDGWPGQTDTQAVIADMRSAAEAQTARIAELEAALGELRADVAATPDPSEAISGLEASLTGQVSEVAAAASAATERLGSLDSQLGDLAAQVEELAMRPVPEGLDPASLDAELSRFRNELSAAVEEARSGIVAAQEEAAAIASRAAEEAAAQEAAAAEEAEATRAAAEAAAAAAAREAAAARILAALDSGEPYADALAELGADVPEALAAPAADGVPTLTALAAAFPDAARAALDAAIRAEAGEGAMDRFTAFMRVQTGARSLEPREGADPDAILSRAEAAIRAGDLAAALAELSALPEAGRFEMASWTQAAETRLQALEAAQSLSQD